MLSLEACPDCGSPTEVDDEGEIRCTQCNLFVREATEEEIDESGVVLRRWREFREDERD
jgi:uncharacterized Zn finger protein (UPF0148 family)